MHNETTELVTQSQYARLRGLSHSTISRQVRDGKIPVTADGLIDVAAADRGRINNLDALKRHDWKRRKSRPLPSNRAPVGPSGSTIAESGDSDRTSPIASGAGVRAAIPSLDSCADEIAGTGDGRHQIETEAFRLGERAGVAWGCHKLCKSIIESLPKLLIQTSAPLPIEDLRGRMYACALVYHLMLGWCEEPLADAARMGSPALPEIAFEGAMGDTARQLFQEWLEYYRSGEAA